MQHIKTYFLPSQNVTYHFLNIDILFDSNNTINYLPNTINGRATTDAVSNIVKRQTNLALCFIVKCIELSNEYM